MEQNIKKTRNYFRYKLGFRDRAINRVINKYKSDKCISGDSETGEMIQADWNAFMSWWGTVKDGFKESYFKKQKSMDYHDWWQESNLDGSFAYNGVTDDF